MPPLAGPPRPRRAEVLAALSLAIDLGLGLPMEHVLRSSLVADLVAERAGLDEQERATVYYTNLVLWIGCHADSHEFSRWFGDDLAMRRDSYAVDWSGLPYLLFLLRATGRGLPAGRRAATLATLMLAPRTRLAAMIHSHCLSAGVLAERVGLPAEVGAAVGHAFERWDGSGLPRGCRGEDVPRATRVVQLAEVTEVHLRAHGVGAALAMARERSGRQFDPALVDVLTGLRGELGALADQDAWAASLALAPDRDAVLDDAELDDLLVALGDFADLKCPFTLGHARAVAALAAAAAAHLGLPDAEVACVRRAGLVHGLGRMGVPNSVWERTGPLSEADRERIRLYPYLTGRILSRVPGLADVAAVAAAHHERQDGSGYPRGSSGATHSVAQRVLAAAESYRTSCETRPHRPALDAPAAARRLRAEVAAGRLDPTAVEAVLACAGHPVRARVSWPAGLTTREVEVLGLLARAHPNAEIARRLSISSKTVRNHVEHIYAKLGVSNRTGAGLFAVTHGLLGPADTEDGAPAP